MSVVMVLVSVSMAVLVPAGARSEKADSLCLHFSGLKENLHLELRKGFSINGDLPMTVCDISPGERWGITVDGAGLEKRKGHLSLDRSGNPRIEGERLGAMMRNAVLPGWGAVSTSRKVSGWTDFILISFSLGYFLKENFEYDDLRDDYDHLKESYESATTYEERTLLGRGLNAAALELNIQNDHRKRILYLTAAMYAYQLLDPILFNRPPGHRTQAGGSILELDTAYAGRMKAFLHSLICPGRGQFYQGKTTRGFLYAGLNAAAGFGRGACSLGAWPSWPNEDSASHPPKSSHKT